MQVLGIGRFVKKAEEDNLLEGNFVGKEDTQENARKFKKPANFKA